MTIHFKTKKIALSLICLLLITLTSCEEDSIFLPVEKKIQGEWKYEKVEFQKTFSFSKKNITADYKDLIIEFNGDNSLVQTSNTANRDAAGSWDIECMYSGVTFDDEDVDQTTQFVKGHLTDIASGYKTNFEWENLRVTRKKLSFTERRNGGIYRFKLRKQ